MLSWQASLSGNGRQGVGTATAICFRGCVQSFTSSSSFTPPSIITESCYDFSLSAQCRRPCRRDRTSPTPHAVSFSSLPPMVVNDDKVTDRSDCLGGGGRRLHQSELVPSRESHQPAYSASRVSSPDSRRQHSHDSSTPLCSFLPSVGVVSGSHNSGLLTPSPHHQQQVFGCQSPDFPCPSRCQQQEPSSASCLNESVPMVALDCELPLSGRLSPPSDPSALPSHFLPAVSSSTAAHRSDINGLTAASVVDSVRCPVTGTSVTMSSSFSRAAVSSSNHGVSSSICRSAAVSSSPFQQEEAAPLGPTHNNSLADLSDSPAAGQILPLVTTASPCLPAVSSSSSACCEGSEAFLCSVTMSATFSQAISSSSNVDVDSHHHLLEPTSLLLPRLTPLAGSSSCRKRRFSHCREDADNAVSASGLEVHNGLNDEEEGVADDSVTCDRCVEECSGQHGESPSKRLRLQEETEASSSHAVETNDVECVGLDSVVETDGEHSSEHAVIEENDGQMDFSVQTSVEEEEQMSYGVQNSVDVTAMDSDIAVTPGCEQTPAEAAEATESFVVGQSAHGLLEEEPDSVVEVDVVGVDNTADPHSADYDHHNHHNYHHQPNPDIPEAEHGSHRVNIMMMHREDVSACMDTTEHCCGGGVGGGGGGGGGVSENSSEDGENDADNDDDDSAFFYPSLRPHRISPFLNTPKQRKEERRKILKLSIHKMRAVEDPEHFLRRSVLINNTMKRLQRELREEKLRNSPRRGCYGLYRRASPLHYDVLNNSYLLHDEPFTVGESDRITDDMTDALVTRLEATTTSSPHIVVPTPSPSPGPVDQPDTSSADFPSVSSSSEEVSTSSMTSCSLDVTSTVSEPASELSADLTSSSLSEPPSAPMSENLTNQSDHHYSQHHHHHHHHHHHESEVPDLMPSLATESEALSSTSLSDLSSPVSSLSSSSSQHSSSQAGVLCEGVFGVQSVVREAQSSSTSCSSESQREKQLYADIDTVFNLIHALGDS